VLPHFHPHLLHVHQTKHLDAITHIDSYPSPFLGAHGIVDLVSSCTPQSLTKTSKNAQLKGTIQKQLNKIQLEALPTLFSGLSKFDAQITFT